MEGIGEWEHLVVLLGLRGGGGVVPDLLDVGLDRELPDPGGVHRVQRPWRCANIRGLCRGFTLALAPWERPLERELVVR